MALFKVVNYVKGTRLLKIGSVYRMDDAEASYILKNPALFSNLLPSIRFISNEYEDFVERDWTFGYLPAAKPNAKGKVITTATPEEVSNKSEVSVSGDEAILSVDEIREAEERQREYNDRQTILYGLHWQTLREIGEQYGIPYTKKEVVIQAILDAEFPLENSQRLSDAEDNLYYPEEVIEEVEYPADADEIEEDSEQE